MHYDVFVQITGSLYFDVTKVENSCVIDEVFARCSLYSTVLDVVTYTYESNTMYLHTLKVHSYLDVT